MNINIITNVIGVLTAAFGGYTTYVESLCEDCAFDWGKLVLYLGVALVAYFTGKESKPAEPII